MDRSNDRLLSCAGPGLVPVLRAMSRRLRRVFHVGVMSVLVAAGGGIHRGPRTDNALKKCEDEQIKLRLELNRKNERLDRFRQLNKDGSLKGDQ